MTTRFEPKIVSVKLSDVEPIWGEIYEKRTLGCLLDEDFSMRDRVFEILKPEDFCSEPHKKICEAIHFLHESKIEFSFMAVIQWLRERHVLEACGDLAYLGNLRGEVKSTTNAPDYAEIVKRKSNLRKAQMFCIQTLSDIMEHEHEPEEVLSRMAARYAKSQESQAISQTRTAKEVGHEFLQDVLAAQERREKGLPSSDIMLGIPDVDRATGGCLKGEMIVVAARSGEGKSVVGVHAKRVNGKAGHAVGVINLEMKASKYFARAVGAESGIDTAAMRDGYLNNTDLHLVMEWEKEISDWPLFYETCTDLSASQFKAVARKLVHKHKVKVIIVDYLQLMNDDSETGSREQEVARISRAIKQTAIELDIPIIVLAQLNRQATGEPSIHHLRESGSITQDADKIILLHRHDIDDDAIAADLYPTKVILGKQRDGRIGAAEYILEGKFCRLKPAPRKAI